MFKFIKRQDTAQTKPLSFTEWLNQNNTSITAHLIEAGRIFVANHAERLKTPLSNLILDNRWHYIDKAKKESYRGTLSTNSEGLPHLKLAYYSFRNGGSSEKFDSRAVIKELWIQSLSGVAIPEIKPQNKPIESIIPTIDYIKRDLELWQNLSENGTSHYLNRKGLGNLTIPGIRFAPLHIAVQIVNTAGVVQGLQTIYNDGQKRFTKGLAKKGHFALIGLNALPEHLPTIHICEGVATAASVYLSLNEPVFAALDAFNLLPVARQLKKRFPKTKIIFWADNDWQKADKILSNGYPLGNTGLIQANIAAFKLRDALVCTPDFTFIPNFPAVISHRTIKEWMTSFTDNSVFLMQTLLSLPVLEWMLLESLANDALHIAKQKASATDFNDLMQLGGLNKIEATEPQRPDIALALTHELRKYQKYNFGVISHNQFEQGARSTYNSRYLPTMDLTPGVHLIKSPIGTGKTAVVEALVKANPEQTVLFTTHLISLVESAATRLDLCSYNECDNYDLQIETRLAICLNSLGKLTANASLRDYDIVIIDEIEQVLARLTTHIEQKPLVFSVLMHVMAHAKTLICLDAHLSRSTVQLIQATCWDKPVTVHINTHANEEKREIILHDSTESVQLEAMRVLNNDQTVFLTFNSKADAHKTFSTIKATLPDKKGLYIASDNAGDQANQAFFKNVNKVSKEYDYLICTPSVSTGVSIDNGHFDFVGGIFLGSVNTANDCMQALGRVRNATVRHVYCEKRYAHHPLDADTISARWLATHRHDLNLMRLTNEGARVIMDAHYEALCLSVTLARNRSLNDFYQEFALLSLDEGIKLSYAECSVDKETKKQFRQFKQAFVQAEAQAIGLADIPESATALRELLNLPRKSMNETRSFKKQQTIEFFNLDSKDTESIQALASMDNDNRLKKQIQNLELALSSEDEAKVQFLKQTEKSPQFAADVKHYATTQVLFQQLLIALRLLSDKNTLNVADYRYTKETLLNGGFIDFIETNRAVLRGIMSLPSPDQLQHDPIRFVGTLLAKMGLKQKRVGRSENATYHIDEDRISLLNGILLKRRKGFLGSSIPLDTQSIATKKATPLDTLTMCLESIKRFFCPETPKLAFI